MSPWRTQTKHSSSSEMGIEISLKSMDFKNLVVRCHVLTDRDLGTGVDEKRDSGDPSLD